MPRQRDDKPTFVQTDPAQPRFFPPHVAAPLAQSAWQQLRGLAPEPSPASPADLVALARTNLQARRRRTRHLPDAIFGEPAWDMLLALYAESRSSNRATVSNLGSYSGAPPTTALRWIDYLERGEWIVRKPCPTDRRVVFIDLTDKGRAAIEAYLEDMIAQGMAAPVEI